MAYRARNILIAVALAAVAALLTSFYVTSYKRHVQRGEDHVTVLVAKKDIPEGTSGADAGGLLATSLDVPRKSVVPGRDLQRRPDRRASSPPSRRSQGEQVTTRRFNPSHAGRRPRRSSQGHPPRPRGRRATRTSCSPARSRTATSVDFVAALKKPGDQDIYFSRVLVRDVKVLQAPDAPPAGSKLTGGAQLELQGHARDERQPGPEVPVPARECGRHRPRSAGTSSSARSRTTPTAPTTSTASKASSAAASAPASGGRSAARRPR